MAVGFVEGGQRVAVNIKYGAYDTISYEWNNDFGARTTAACDMSGKELHVGYHLSASFSPCCAAYATSMSDTVASYVALERAEHQLLAFHQVEAYPKPTESLAQSGCRVGKYAHLFMLIADIGNEIFEKLLVAGCLVYVLIAELWFHILNSLYYFFNQIVYCTLIACVRLLGATVGDYHTHGHGLVPE